MEGQIQMISQAYSSSDCVETLGLRNEYIDHLAFRLCGGSELRLRIQDSCSGWVSERLSNSSKIAYAAYKVEGSRFLSAEKTRSPKDIHHNLCSFLFKLG